MDIQRIPVSRINPAKYNPRKDLKPGDPEYEKLARSIQEFGFVEPLVWNRRTGNLIGGHQRLKILLADGAAEVECSVVDLDGPREKALNVALNKIGGDWDLPRLRDLLVDIQRSDIDAALTGFDQAEIEKMLKTADEIQHDMSAQKSGASPWERMNSAGSEGVIFHFGALTCKIPEPIYNDFFALVDENRLAESIAEVLSRAVRNS